MSLVEDALNKLRVANAAESAHGASSRRPAKPAFTSVAVPATGAPAARRQVGDGSRLLMINMEELRREHLVPPESQEHRVAQQFRAVKRPLIKAALEAAQLSGSAGGTHGRSIMVSSALSGDGKTFTSINLALSLARERDYSVLLVDGDAAKPHISRVLNLSNHDGLLELIKEPGRPVESVILPTSIPGLSILPAGKRSDGVTELLSSSRMRQVVAELEALDPHLLVVVDSPPVLLTSEAKVMASLFGQILMVVRAGMTPQYAVSESIAALGENAPIKLMLNEAVHNQGSQYYGYGYGYNQPQDEQQSS